MFHILSVLFKVNYTLVHIGLCKVSNCWLSLKTLKAFQKPINCNKTWIHNNTAYVRGFFSSEKSLPFWGPALLGLQTLQNAKTAVSPFFQQSIGRVALSSLFRVTVMTWRQASVTSPLYDVLAHTKYLLHCVLIFFCIFCLLCFSLWILQQSVTTTGHC